MTLGNKIRLAREAAGLSQAALSELCDVDPPSVSRWEGDENRPRPQKLLLISEATKRPIGWFLGEPDRLPKDEIEQLVREMIEEQIEKSGIDLKEKGKTPEEIEAFNIELQLIQVFRDLRNDQRKALLGIARGLLTGNDTQTLSKAKRR